MFTPRLSAAQRRAVTDLRTRLASALEPVVVDEPPELAQIIIRRNELRAEISGIERNAGAGNLEERAQILANRKAQEHLVDVRLKELSEKRERAEAEGRKKSAEALDALAGEAHNLLADVAKDLHDQHRTAFEAAAVQYATTPAQSHQLVNLFPFFVNYLRAIRRFQENGNDPARLLQFLGAALEGKDFLMPSC